MFFPDVFMPSAWLRQNRPAAHVSAERGLLRDRRCVLSGALALLVLVLAARAAAICCGDCNGDGMVAVNELVTAVSYALNGCPIGGACCGDCDGSGSVTVNELVTAVGNALSGCPPPPPTRTPKLGCPFDLLHPGGTMVCQFGAHLQGTCPKTLKSFWASDGTTVVVVFPGTIFGGRVISATSAQLIGWTTSPSGPIQNARHGDTLKIVANGEAIDAGYPPSVDGCAFDRGDGGNFIGVIANPEPSTVEAARATFAGAP